MHGVFAARFPACHPPSRMFEFWLCELDRAPERARGYYAISSLHSRLRLTLFIQ